MSAESCHAGPKTPSEGRAAQEGTTARVAHAPMDRRHPQHSGHRSHAPSRRSTSGHSYSTLEVPIRVQKFILKFWAAFPPQMEGKSARSTPGILDLPFTSRIRYSVRPRREIVRSEGSQNADLQIGENLALNPRRKRDPRTGNGRTIFDPPGNSEPGSPASPDARSTRSEEHQSADLQIGEHSVLQS